MLEWGAAIPKTGGVPGVAEVAVAVEVAAGAVVAVVTVGAAQIPC